MGGTWVFNTGQQIGPTPANIALHLAHGEAIWTSLEGCQILSLSEPPVRPFARMREIPDWFRAADPPGPRPASPDAPAAG
jgi:hypothetical protein